MRASSRPSQSICHQRDHQCTDSGNNARQRSSSRHLSDRMPTRLRVDNSVHNDCPRGGAMDVGHVVRVFSRSLDGWVDAWITKREESSFVRVEYEIGDDWCGKSLHVHSDHLAMTSAFCSSCEECDPECAFQQHCDPACHGLLLQQLLDFHTTHCKHLDVMCSEKNKIRPERKRPLEPNMYAVVELVIKPLTKKAGGCSYAEFVNPDGRGVDLFVSHSWKHPFNEFVQSIDRHANVTQNPGEQVRNRSYWICSFANSQHDVAALLNVTLEQSPFELALRASKGTIMIVDEEVTPLTRIWCLYEVFRTCELKRPFHFINHREVLSLTRRTGHEMRIIQERIRQIDFCSAEASNAEDRRKIMAAVGRFRFADTRLGRPDLEGVAALSWLVKDFLEKRTEMVLDRRATVQEAAHGWSMEMLPGFPKAWGKGSILPVLGEASGGHCWKVELADGKHERVKKDKEGIWWQWVKPSDEGPPSFGN